MKKAEQAKLNLQPQETAPLERTYKDSVFVTVFHEKDKLIELYNALFDTDYGPDTAIDIVTIKDVLFRTLKNDVSFVLDKRFVVLVEHQSTINGNLPLRDLLYIATVLKRMIDSKQLYREKTLRIPKPAFIVLYNGSEDIPAYQELRLSDAYLGEKNDTEEEFDSARGYHPTLEKPLSFMLCGFSLSNADTFGIFRRAILYEDDIYHPFYDTKIHNERRLRECKEIQRLPHFMNVYQERIILPASQIPLPIRSNPWKIMPVGMVSGISPRTVILLTKKTATTKKQ